MYSGNESSNISIELDLKDDYAIVRAIRALSAIVYVPKPVEVKKKKKK